MGDSADFPASDERRERKWIDAADWVDTSEPKQSKEELQEIAHSRGRICKERGCEVCAPLRERRRLKKAQRKAAAQALAHEKGEPCNRVSCVVDVCVAARDAAPAASPPAVPSDDRPRSDRSPEDPDQVRRRQAKRHRAGVPCGSEDCPNQQCIDGFVNERTRRHRARRPCRSATCDNPICVSGRSTH